MTLTVFLSFDIRADGDMVQIGELNTAMNTFNVSDTIRWAGMRYLNSHFINCRQA